MLFSAPVIVPWNFLLAKPYYWREWESGEVRQARSFYLVWSLIREVGLIDKDALSLHLPLTPVLSPALSRQAPAKETSNQSVCLNLHLLSTCQSWRPPVLPRSWPSFEVGAGCDYLGREPRWAMGVLAPPNSSSCSQDQPPSDWTESWPFLGTFRYLGSFAAWSGTGTSPHWSRSVARARTGAFQCWWNTWHSRETMNQSWNPYTANFESRVQTILWVRCQTEFSDSLESPPLRRSNRSPWFLSVQLRCHWPGCCCRCLQPRSMSTASRG